MTAVHKPQDPMTPVAPGPEEDASLIRLAQGGDREAYDRLVRRYLPRAYTVAFRVSGNRQDAEDLVQDGFMSAYRSIDRFEVGRPFGPWLYRIITNAAVSHLRREWHDEDGFTAEELGESLGVPSGTVRWYLHQARQTLRKALAPWHGTLEESNDEH